jgi:hypothetical protein
VITKSGLVKLKLKTTYGDANLDLLFTTGDFIEKLIAIIYPPKCNLVKPDLFPLINWEFSNR